MSMKALFAAFYIFYASNIFAGQEMFKPKPDTVKEIINATQEVYYIAITKSQADHSYVKAKLQGVLSRLRSLDQIATFAVISRSLAYPGNAGDEYFDQWFDKAFWMSVELIADNASNEGYRILQKLKQRIDLDGGDNLTFDNFLSKHQSHGEN